MESDTDAPTPTDSTSPSPAPEGLSSTGIVAMQGKSDTIPPTAASDWHTGRAAELSALEKIEQTQGRAIDLNSPAEGGNRSFKIYDVAGPDTVASVKHFGQHETDSLSDQTLTNYRLAFHETIGNGADPKKFEKAAEDLQQLSLEGKPVPPELRDNPLEYLQNRSEIWVPKDHEYQIKDDLHRRLLSDDELSRKVYASQFNLNCGSETYAQEVQDLLSRIKPLSNTSQELVDKFTRR